MDAERWRRLQRILADVLERPTGERAAFVDSACAADPTLRAEVLRYLALEETASSVFPDAGRDEEPRTIGPYRTLRVLGVGSSSVVYEAERERPHRLVALKVMRVRFAAAGAVRRFEQEAEVLARLQHPAIAAVHDAGSSEDRGEPVSYIAMERIDGPRTIVEHAREAQLPIRDRVRLFVEVCRGVHHAHQRGVLHRDLKPANVLVDPSGRPKVVDFGVARVTGVDSLSTAHTRAGDLVGTLAWMSPEQCTLPADSLDVRADVYALGVILYQLTCGRLPVNVAGLSLAAAARAIVEHAPARPSSIDPSCAGDLETICLVALEKDRDRRFGSAAQLADDLERWLAHRPIAARRATLVHRSRLFVRRHPWRAAAFAAVLVGATATATLIAAQSVAHARREAEQHARTARVLRFLQDVLALGDPSTSGRPALTVRELLDAAAADVGRELQDDPNVEAQVLATLCASYYGMGDYPAAETQAVRLLHMAETSRSVSESVRAMQRLGAIRTSMGSTLEGGRLLRKAHDTATAAGVGDDLLADVERDLSNALCRVDRLAEAEVLSRRVLDHERRQGNSKRLVEAQSQLASVLAERGRTDEAEQLLREALATSRDAGPEGMLVAAEVRLNLGSLLDDAGRLEEAETIEREALAMLRDHLPSNHPFLALALNHLGTLLVRTETASEEGKSLLREAIASLRSSMGDAHPDTRRVLLNLAMVLDHEERLDELEPIARELVAASPPGTAECASATGLLGDALAGLGSPKEAELLYLESWSIVASGIGPPGNVDVAACRLETLYGSWHDR